MYHHVSPFAMNRLFAGRVEMELQQLVGIVTYFQTTRFISSDLNGMPIVFNDQWKRTVIKPKQLKEDRRLVAAINECQKDSGVVAQLEYKLEAGESALDAKAFLMKKAPPIVTLL
jgi:hypothetical protein